MITSHVQGLELYAVGSGELLEDFKVVSSKQFLLDHLRPLVSLYPDLAPFFGV
jgi:hypothetical protein